MVVDKKKKAHSSTYFIESINKDLPSVTTILGQLDKSGPLMGWAVKITVGYIASKLDEIRAGTLELTENNASMFLKEAKKQHKELKEKSAELGSEVHNLIEVYLKNQNIAGLLSGNPKLVIPFEAFKNWQSTYKFKLVNSEHIVWSIDGFAGTLDCVAELNGKLYLVDFKTSNAIYDEYIMQVAAYAHAYEERTGLKFAGWGILRLGKEDGLSEWREISKAEIDHAYKMFVCLKDFWTIKKKGL